MQPMVGSTKLRETTMRQFAISAAAVTVFAAMLASIPAQADTLGGAPLQSAGQCFKFSVGQQREGRFGYWSACPQTASVAPQRHTRKHHQSSR
jgi:hypothetical protein